jgi:hypothetical protein
MSPHRQHYHPEPAERRPGSVLQLLQAFTIAALIGGPFVLYFWSMKP